MATLNELDVYIFCRQTTSLDASAVKAAEQHLSVEELARRDRFRFEGDRRDFTIAHDLLRRALSTQADALPSDWRFTSNKYGKPTIDSIDPQLQTLSFSLSHTRGYVACAITSKAPLGVDVERIDKFQQAEEIAGRYFSKKEAEWLRQCSDELRNIRLTELWTLKEAYLKADGVGLSGSLSGVSFRFDDQTGIEFSGSSAIDPQQWHFALLEPDYDVRLAIGVRSVARPRLLMRQDDGDGRAIAPIRMSGG
jgi:phosphopantetheinyl transferase